MRSKGKLLSGKYIRQILFVSDCLIYNLLFWLVLVLFPNITHVNGAKWLIWVMLNASLVPVYIFQINFRSLDYRRIVLDRVFINAVLSVFIHALFFLSLIGFLDRVNMPTKAYVVYYGLVLIVEALWSIISRKLIKEYRRKGRNYVSVVIVGTNPISERLYKEMLVDSGYGYKVLSFFSQDNLTEYCGVECRNINELPDYAKSQKIDQIFFVIPGNDETMERVVQISDENLIEFFYVPLISQYVARNFDSDKIGSVAIIPIRNNPLKNRYNQVLKRTFDILFSSFCMIFYPLVYIPVAIAIKMSSPGPVYFKQLRTGYKGKPFYCLKFRSMTVNSHADDQQATRNDSRTTKVGAFIRRMSIDELPQLINVFKGDMSLVGPRPHMLKHTEEYSRLVDKYMVRHLIKPGITGWAQVHGLRGQTDELWKMEKRVEHDVWYIEHWSFSLDLKIIVATVLNTFKKDDNAF